MIKPKRYLVLYKRVSMTQVVIRSHGTTLFSYIDKPLTDDKYTVTEYQLNGLKAVYGRENITWRLIDED